MKSAIEMQERAKLVLFNQEPHPPPNWALKQKAHQKARRANAPCSKMPPLKKMRSLSLSIITASGSQLPQGLLLGWRKKQSVLAVREHQKMNIRGVYRCKLQKFMAFEKREVEVKRTPALISGLPRFKATKPNIRFLNSCLK